MDNEDAKREWIDVLAEQIAQYYEASDYAGSVEFLAVRQERSQVAPEELADYEGFLPELTDSAVIGINLRTDSLTPELLRAAYERYIAGLTKD